MGIILASEPAPRMADQEGRRNEALYRTIVEYQTEFIVRWLPDWTRTYVNPAYCRFFKQPAEELIGTSFLPLVAEEDRRKIEEKIRRLTPEKPHATGDHRVILPDGSIGWQQWTDRGTFDSSGNLVELQSVGRDVTVRKRAEEALRKSEERYRILFESANDGIMVSRGNRFLYCNSKMCNLLERTQEELMGRSPWEISPPLQPDGRDSGEKGREIFERDSAGKRMVFEWVHTRGDGSLIDLEISLSKLPPEEDPTFLCISRDNRERKAAEKAIESLRGRLTQAQEEERRRIARDLHDDINQRLALVNLELESIRRSPSSLPDPIREQLRSLSRVVGQLSTDIHNISYRLHPAKLEQLGLVSVIRTLCEEISGQNGVDIRFFPIAIPDTIPHPISLCLYRIAQESLQNIVKHSGARRARVRLTGTSGSLHLQVSDSGAGFDPRAIQEKSGLGLYGIRERLQPLGGNFSIDSRPGGGTRVDVRIPLNARPG